DDEQRLRAYGLVGFRDFCVRKTPSSASLRDLDKPVLAALAGQFLEQTRSRQGTLYGARALRRFQIGLNNYLRTVFGSDFDLTRDPLFADVKGFFATAYGRVALPRPSPAVVKLCPVPSNGQSADAVVIGTEDLTKIGQYFWKVINTPRGLQQKVWFDLMIHLGSEGIENQHSMRKESFVILKSQADGRRRLQWPVKAGSAQKHKGILCSVPCLEAFMKAKEMRQNIRVSFKDGTRVPQYTLSNHVGTGAAMVAAGGAVVGSAMAHGTQAKIIVRPSAVPALVKRQPSKEELQLLGKNIPDDVYSFIQQVARIQALGHPIQEGVPSVFEQDGSSVDAQEWSLPDELLQLAMNVGKRPLGGTPAGKQTAAVAANSVLQRNIKRVKIEPTLKISHVGMQPVALQHRPMVVQRSQLLAGGKKVIKREPGVDVPEASKPTSTMHNPIVRIKKEETPLREKLENNNRLPRCKVEVVHSAQDRKCPLVRPRQTVVTVRPPIRTPFYEHPLSHTMQTSKEDMLKSSQESFVKQPLQQQALPHSPVHSIHKHQLSEHKSMPVDDQCSASDPDPMLNHLRQQPEMQQGLKQPLHDFSNPLHMHHPGLHRPQLEFHKDPHFQFHTSQDFARPEQEHLGHYNHNHAINNHEYQEFHHHQQQQQQQSPSLQQEQQHQLLGSPQPELHELQTIKGPSLQQDLQQQPYASSMHYPLQQPDPLGFQPLSTTAFAAQPPQPQQTLFQPHMPHFAQSLHQQHYQPYPLYQPQQYHQYSPFQQQQYQYQYQHHLQHRPLLAGPDLVGKLEVPNGL
ncbi:unnamed protein product, partial [Ixodes hexagonus]